MRKNGIRLLHYGIVGNKEPFVEIPEETVAPGFMSVRQI